MTKQLSLQLERKGKLNALGLFLPSPRTQYLFPWDQHHFEITLQI